MDAAAYGALFFLATAVSALAGGTKWPTDADNALAIILSSAGVGSLLYLLGRAIWEFAFPYVPGRKGSGLGSLGSKSESFRLTLADEYVGSLPDFKGLTLDDEHKKVIAVERVFYTSAPDSIVQWCRRRYDRFVQALSASAALVFGILAGLVIGGPESMWLLKILVDVVLLVVVALTMGWAIEVRGHAQAMESAWFFTWHKTKDVVAPTAIAFTAPGDTPDTFKVVSPLSVGLAKDAALDVRDNVTIGLGR